MEQNFGMKQSQQKKRPLSQSYRIQELFLNHCRRGKINVVIQLFDQSIVEGLIIGFDQESIVVSSRGIQQLLYKSSIVCIRPFEELHLIFNDGLRGGRQGSAYPRIASSTSYRHH